MVGEERVKSFEMKFYPRRKDRRLLFWAVLFVVVLLIATALSSCADINQTYLLAPRQPCNEKIKLFRNWWVLTNEDFMEYAKYMAPEGYTHMRVLYWYGHGLRRGKIDMVVFYYE